MKHVCPNIYPSFKSDIFQTYDTKCIKYNLLNVQHSEEDKELTGFLKFL